MERKFSFIITVNACVSNGRGSPVKESISSGHFSFHQLIANKEKKRNQLKDEKKMMSVMS